MTEAKHPGKLPKFIKSLYDICMVPAAHQNQDLAEVVVWEEATNSFFVTDIEYFSSKVLGLYFSHSNLSSFVRQLNHYGFSKISRSDGLVQYFHKDFILGNYKRLYNFTKPRLSGKDDLAHDNCTDYEDCAKCKKLTQRVDKLEFVVKSLCREVAELKLVNKALMANFYKEKM